MKKILLITLFVLSGAGTVQAQILIEKGKVERTVQPGGTVMESFTVNNTTDKPVKVKAYFEDFIYEAPFDGKKKFLPAKTTDHSVSGWVNYSPNNFTLAPYGRQKISYIIKVPQDAKGGYYGVLFFEEDSGEVTPQKLGIRIVTRVGSLFFIETNNKSKQSLVKNITADGSTVEGEFHNAGDVIIIPNGTYFVMNQEGVALDRGEVDKLYLPPGESGRFSLDIDQNIPQGKYTVILTFDLQEGDVVVREVELEKSSAGFRVLEVRE